MKAVRISAVVIAVSLAVLTFRLPGIFIASAADWRDVLSYEINGDNSQIVITGCDRAVPGILEIPAEIEGLPVVSIADEAFSGCTFLTEIQLPACLVSVGWKAFAGCTSLQDIDVLAGGASFSDDNGVLYTADRQTLLLCPEGKSGRYTVPDGTQTVGYNAFCGCALLTGILLPDSVTTIQNGAFYGCTQLTGITLSDSLVSLGWSVFTDCVSLTEMAVPDGVQSIGYYAFRGCVSLAEITLPESLTIIGGYAFRDCVSLTAVTVPKGVAAIKGFAFYNCVSLSSVSLPASLTSIAGYAFCGCTALKSVTVPNSVTFIGNHVFGYATDGEPSDGILMRCYKNSAAEKYAKDNGFACEITGGMTLELKDGAGLTVTPEGFVISAKAGLSVSALLGSFVNNGTAVFRGGARIGADGLAGTGFTVRLYDGGTMIDSLTLVVLGDTDGSGTADIDDAQSVLSAATQIKAQPTGAFFLAADVTGDGILTAADARKVLRVASKMESFAL